MAREIRDWNGNVIGVTPDKGENPMLVHGYGPTGAKCSGCAHFKRLNYHNVTYRKCELRGINHGAGTDHKANWPACKKYEAGEEPTPQQRERRPQDDDTLQQMIAAIDKAEKARGQ